MYRQVHRSCICQCSYLQIRGPAPIILPYFCVAALEFLALNLLKQSNVTCRQPASMLESNKQDSSWLLLVPV